MEKFYVGNGHIALSVYDTDNDSLLSIATSEDTYKWIQFSHKDAEQASKTTGFQIISITKPKGGE